MMLLWLPQFFQMAPVFLLAVFFIAASASYLLYLLVKIVHAWWHHEWVMEQGEKLSAKIVAVEVMADENRTVPFVKMKLQVDDEKNIIYTAEGFYRRSELAYLQVGNFVSAVFHPTDKQKLQLVKEQPEALRSKEPTAVLSIPPKRKLSVA